MLARDQVSVLLFAYTLLLPRLFKDKCGLLVFLWCLGVDRADDLAVIDVELRERR